MGLGLASSLVPIPSDITRLAVADAPIYYELLEEWKDARSKANGQQTISRVCNAPWDSLSLFLADAVPITANNTRLSVALRVGGTLLHDFFSLSANPASLSSQPHFSRRNCNKLMNNTETTGTVDN